MFHLQTLELVHWDYCQRVSLPLDASIITIAGPNGSGKTTLLDAMRTLLGLRCSAPRDYRTYARHAGAQTAWLRAVVDNRAQGRQTSSRPFARRLLYSDQVTLACRIDRNGGDWQRRYCLLDGDVGIEQLRDTPEKDLGFMGVEAWGRVLGAAGLSPAIARVLSLEQGQTDRLCEFSPRELLRLVFDVFGDQQVLDAYDQAREHQQQLVREMAQAERELDHGRAQLAELQNRVASYQSWQMKIAERERLATEVLPVLAWHGEREGLTKQARELRRQKTQHRSALADQAVQNKRLLTLIEESARAQSDATRLLAERDEARGALDDATRHESPLEQLAKREQELLALVDKGSNADELQAHLARLQAQEAEAQDERSALQQRRKLAQEALKALEGQHLPPLPHEVQQFRKRLVAQGIGHQFVAEVVEVADEEWRAAIEGVLRGHRWVVLLDKEADLAEAYEIGERERYRHYLVGPGEKALKGDPGTLLSHVRFTAPVPRWLVQQLQQLRCVADPREGKRLGGTWITPQAYMHDGRGARSMWVEPREHQFGAAAVHARRNAAERDAAQIDALLAPVLDRVLALKRQITDTRRALEGHSAAEELARRSDEFAQAREVLPAAKQARIAAAQRWQRLDTEATRAHDRHRAFADEHQRLEQQLKRARSDSDRAAQEWTARRRSHVVATAQSQRQRHGFPPRWIALATLESLVDEYVNDTQARLRLQSVEQELEHNTWEQDATVEERHRRMETTVREQTLSLSDHQAKNAQAGTAVHNARESYIEVLRSTVRRYRKNIQELGALAGVEVAADLPLLENDDTVLSQAGLKVHFAFDGKGSIGMNDGEASGGQQVIKSLILLVGLLKDEESGSGGFVFIDEPFAHLDVRNIQLVGHFLRSTQAQYVLTTPITHNLEVFEPAEITLVTSKKPQGSRWAPPIAVAKRRGVPVLEPVPA
ncbi:ATP-binding protein [Paracidovorax valerianellae]|uniref:P-loop containing region of AAA domain-containing protein n=1 Tax=Paracidovorax valerianellae TaxID=187868 RepID=A0A1G6RMA8_9BURK|nr:ATP-binding protein [Paracidovorax valerianellae]MDA8444089.1 AAA family ATPase [Paracidovorax valerianellae]SDD05135.1 P-loop containing region of AAA domain-containing protein [Paracidovorax valerianellae]